jgi:uncharacterized RDD family membrane protein YckC
VNNQITKETKLFQRRIGTFIIDMLFIYLFRLIILYAVSLIILAVQAIIRKPIISDIAAFTFLVSIFVFFGYYIITEKRSGQTIGKYITQTKVITKKGVKLTYPQLFLRTACRLLPFEFLSFFSSDVQGLHDKISNTKVILIDDKIENNVLDTAT